MRQTIRIPRNVVLTAAVAGLLVLQGYGASLAEPTSKAPNVTAPKGKAVTAPKGKATIQKPGTKAPVGGVRPGLTVAPLTTPECTKLGGRVDASDASCTGKGQFTCRTVTIDGNGNTKVNTACIDEVAQ